MVPVDNKLQNQQLPPENSFSIIDESPSQEQIRAMRNLSLKNQQSSLTNNKNKIKANKIPQNILPQSRKGFKLKRKTKEQVSAMRSFFIKTKDGKWHKDEVETLAQKIKLDFKSVNKWLWDKKNKIELANMEK